MMTDVDGCARGTAIHLSDHERMLNIIYGLGQAQVVHCAARFSIAEHLADGPRSALFVAEAEGLDPDATYRLLRAATCFGLVTHDPVSGFSGTGLLRTLLKSDSASLCGHALSWLGSGF